LADDCPSGVTWFQVSGYNSGEAFQAYVDSSVDGVHMLVYHHMLYSGEVRINHPTSNQDAEGTPGFGSHRLGNVNTLLTAMCPSTVSPARFYVGQHDNDGSTLASGSNSQWIAWTDKIGSEFVDMFDSTPSSASFTGSGMRRSDGTTNGAYSHTTGHPTSSGVHQCGTSSSVNSGVLFEYAAPYGTDPNHGFTVWGSGAGQYYNANRPGGTTRFGWLGVSGCQPSP